VCWEDEVLISDAFAQAGAAAGPSPVEGLLQILPMMALMFGVIYFVMIRPQQRRMKAFQDMLGALRKGDVIVSAGGLIGKVKSIADDEVRVELAPNVEVRLLRSSIAEVRNKGEPAPANDSKPTKS
jgi:preprotein translocase subunit YajC